MGHLRVEPGRKHLFLELVHELLPRDLEVPLQDLELGFVLEPLVLEVVDDIRRTQVDLLTLLLAARCSSASSGNTGSCKYEDRKMVGYFLREILKIPLKKMPFGYSKNKN